MSIYLLILALLIYFQGIKPARNLFKTQAFGGQNLKGIFRIARGVLVPSLLFACFISVVAIGFDAAETASQGRRPLFEILNISLLAVLFSGGAALQYAARKAAYESLGLTLTAPPPWQRLKKKINKSR